MGLVVLGEDAFQLLGSEAQVELAFVCHRDASGFFGYDDGQGVGFLRYTHGCTVAEAKLLRDVQVVRDGEDASGCYDLLVADNHRSVVQRAVLEEDILDEALVYVGIDGFSGTDNLVEWDAFFNHNQCSGLSFAHAHTGHDDGHDVGFLVLVLFAWVKESEDVSPTFMRTYGNKELADVVLKQYD